MSIANEKKNELKLALHNVIAKYSTTKKVDLKMAYEFCEPWARKVFGEAWIFKNYQAFKDFRSKSTRKSTTFDEIEEIFKKHQISHPIDIGGLRIFTDVGDHDRVVSEESKRFLSACVKVIRKHVPGYDIDQLKKEIGEQSANKKS